ncbi:aspartate decarboxylase [Maricaulis sp.]|uniref:aspartate decarboxylase n=1 Tax=Maricaulis sp. TaxID=1486257 RepID=UPI0026343F0C|nr:aspartate decarboxylase [Maricaulis sp.]
MSDNETKERPAAADPAAPYGSANNPSEFDVLNKLEKDEPYFIIRGGDPLSDALVELHAYIGAGQSGAAHDTLERILALTSQHPPRPVGSPKYRETFKISVSMERYRETHGRSH